MDSVVYVNHFKVRYFLVYSLLVKQFSALTSLFISASTLTNVKLYEMHPVLYNVTVGKCNQFLGGKFLLFVAKLSCFTETAYKFKEIT